jgi:hypothetical protein
MARKLAKKKNVTTKKKEVEFYEGDIVIVESLKATKRRHGTNTSMMKMIGGEYIIETVEMHHTGQYPVIHIRNSEKESQWAFAPPDLILVKKCSDITSDAMPNDPIMFDPKELV